MEAVRGRFHVWYEGCVIQLILLQNIWVEIAYELIPFLANPSFKAMYDRFDGCIACSDAKSFDA